MSNVGAGVILEEFMMDRVQTLRDTPNSASVIDDLRACIGNDTKKSIQSSAFETNEGSDM